MKWTREFLHLECFLGVCAEDHLQGVVGGVIEGPGAAHNHPEGSAVLEDGLTHVLDMMPCWFFKPKPKNRFSFKILQKGTTKPTAKRCSANRNKTFNKETSQLRTVNLQL
jgi:hypothetical protein